MKKQGIKTYLQSKIIILVMIMFMAFIISLSSTSAFTNITIPCFQEYANQSVSCGNTYSNGTYNYTGSFLTCPTMSYMFDGNYTTGCTSVLGANLYVNYTKPKNFNNTVTWNIKHQVSNNINITVPFSCIQRDIISLWASFSGSINYYYCLNSTGWQLFNSTTGSNGLYEESVTWNFTALTEYNQTFNNSINELYVGYFNIKINYSSYTYSLNPYLYYNNISYLGNIIGSGDNVTIEKNLDIPLISGITQNNSFYWNITLTNIVTGEKYYYISDRNNQTINSLTFIICGAYPLNVPFLNFTIYNETSLVRANSSFQATFIYSTIGSSATKNYSINNLNINSSNYAFCFSPNNSQIVIQDATILFGGNGYAPNQYVLSNTQLNSTINNINLYMLSDSLATKFYVSFRQNALVLTDSIVSISKYFTGLGYYSNVGSATTDTTGKIPAYFEIDKDYQFSVVKDGTLLGIINRKASCATAPCTLDINIDSTISSIYSEYNALYAENILSNMSYNTTSKILTYNFIDTTNLAHYFRLNVVQVKYSGVSVTICNNYAYTSSGSMTCNMTGYEGDFNAVGYISRSPEKKDQILSFIIDGQTVQDLGIYTLLLTIALVGIFVFAIAVISRGSPSAIIFSIMVSILLTKLVHVFPFSWGVTVALEALLFYVLIRTKQ